MINPRHGQYKNRFLKFSLPTMDELHNLAIQKKVNLNEYLLLEHMASYAWDGEHKRNYCIRTISRMAHDFNVERDTVRKWVKTLVQLGLVKKLYQVKFTDTGETRIVSCQKRAFGICKNNRATYHMIFEIHVDGLCVGRGGEKFKESAVGFQYS